ncbi:MAG TPA: VOC family protein [Vicinamibacterales bacterium]|jgi:catechol 2,3-dioxygenase-like lactoylglutathione lyase family enzyme|nr:VOC family protein [Vicinamibacterales bacterium]
MKTLALAATVLFTATFAQAQVQVPAAAPAPTGPAPTGLIVGSGNFFSPIVADLDKALAFYRDGLGFDVQGAPANADANVALRNMFGLPDAQLRWSIGRPAGMRTGVEIVEISKAGGRPVERRLQDSGSFMLIVLVRDLDSIFVRLAQLGAPVVTKGGKPIAVPSGSRARAVVVKDPDGHFVELYQPDPLPAATVASAPNVIEVRVRLAVNDVDQATRLYADQLGIATRTPGTFEGNPAVLDMMGLPAGAQYRASVFTVPTTGLVFELIDFKGVDRRMVKSNLQDPGSTRIQLQVRDVDAAVAAVKAAGGSVQSTGGAPVELPARGGTIKTAIVRDPDNLFLVLLQAAAPAR